MEDVIRRGSARGRRLSGSWTILSSLFKKGHSHVAQMSEGRRSQVVLLDERRLDIIIQSRLYAGELLDIVSSHFNLKEKEYFGLAYIDDTGQYSWLQLDRRVLEHDFPKKSSSQGAVLIFYFRVKYFVESITHLRDSATIEAFYLQAKSFVAKGELDIDSDIIFQLAALVIQATYGDYSDDQIFRSHLKRLPVLPSSTLKEYPSIAVCESKVLEHYKALVGQSRGAAIVNYLSILESLPTYGQHYYEIKDKSGNPCWLGLSYRGISQYDRNDRRTPRRVFLWKQLENLYFRDRKFTVEVHEARRVVHTLSSFNLYEGAIEEPVEEFDDLSSAICDPTTQVSVSRRALAPASVTVYVWYAASPNIAKCIWSMAIAQHQFFLDRSHKKSRSCVVRNLSQIASELCRSVQSLSSASSQSNISRSNSSASLPTIIIEGELSEESKAATIEMLTALQSRKDALQDALKKKTEELKALCLKEGELTGELPPETPFQPGEAQPQVRRRVGTSFTLSDKIICRAKSKDRETLNGLELHYEIQSKIASAAFKLANDVTARKSVRKLRKLSYQQATTKLKDIEQKLCTLKRQKDSQKQNHEASNTDTIDGNRVNRLGLPNSSSDNSISDRSNLNCSLSSGSVPPSTSLPQLAEGTCVSAPPSPAKCRQRHQSLQHVPIVTADVYEDVALPFNIHTRRNSSSYSAASEYDTMSCGSSSIASLGIPYRNRFEANLDIEGTNHYSVPNRRASQAFNDPDDMLDDRSQDILSHSCNDDNHSDRYMNTLTLSSSYDERLSYKSREFPAVSKSAVPTDCSFDKSSTDSNGMLSYSDSNCQLSVPCDAAVETFNHHSQSENSLHAVHSNSLHRKLSQMHISEPELNFDDSENDSSVPLVYNMPTLRNTLRPTGCGLLVNSPTTDYCSGVSNQSINQVADLVQASVLLQDCKRAVSSSSLEYCSPKAKTKEWIETSLDSPMLTKKRKPKASDIASSSSHNQQAQWLENGLPSGFSNDSFYTFQNEQKFYDDPLDFPSSNSSTLRKSPSPSSLQSPCNTGACPVDYLNPNAKHLFSNQGQGERSHSRNSFLSDINQYNQYENSSEISSNLPNPHYENVQISTDYNSNSFKIPDVPVVSRQLAELVHHSQFEDKPSITLTLAEPQQPPKHPNRRVLMDTYTADNVSSVDVSDYQNVPLNSHYDSRNYRDMTNCSSFSQIHCDIPEPAYQYSHNHPYSESQALQRDSFVDNTSDSQQVQNWQQFPVASAGMENSAISPSVPQNMNFAHNVEVNVVSVGHFQPYWEETKPYELSDFYKYSTKHRKQQKSLPPSDSSEILVHHDPNEHSQITDHHFYEQSHRDMSSVSYHDYKYQNEEIHESSLGPMLNQQKELVASHVPVFDSSEQLESPAKYYDGNTVLSSPNESGSQNKSLSFGEMDFRISLADTFQEEMITWYQNQDTVKKATLV